MLLKGLNITKIDEKGKQEQKTEYFRPAQYKSHRCCSLLSLFSIALNVEYTGRPIPTEQLYKKDKKSNHIAKTIKQIRTYEPTVQQYVPSLSKAQTNFTTINQRTEKGHMNILSGYLEDKNPYQCKILYLQIQ